MNRDNHTITDEQLAAYISHSASPEETAAVEAWLAADSSHVDELLDITVAAALPKIRSRSSVHRWYRRPVYWAAAAMVAAVLATTAFLWQQGDGTDNSPMVAQVETPEPSVTPEQDVTEQPAATKNVQHPGMTLQRDERATASQSTLSVEEPVLEVSFPRRQREVCPTGQDIVFRFSSNATQLTLTITDDDGNMLLRAEVSGLEQYTLPATRIGEHPELTWTLMASFSEGQGQRRTGTIEIM